MLLLLAAAWVGHSALWLVGLNVLYSRPLPRRFLRFMRVFTAGVVFGFPIAVAVGGFLGAESLLGVQLYLAACLGMSLVMVPVVTLARRLQHAPTQLVARRGVVVDFARQLGRRPAGNGKYRRLALLPGNQVFQVEFVDVALKLDGIPAAWDGLTILQLSDLHFTGTPERAWYEAVLDRAMADGVPDLLVITGDLVDTDAHHRWILPLMSRLKWKEAGLAILGNHDYWYRPERVRRRLERAGFMVLGNGWRELTIRGESLVVIGHEGPWFPPGPDLSACPVSGFRLCLSHTPDHVTWGRANSIALMLCGHNHGGQIRLPLFGSLFVPSSYSRTYDCGLFDESPTLLYVGRGLGGREPLRYNCRPEVTRFTLRKG